MTRCAHCGHESRSSLMAGAEPGRCEACGALLPLANRPSPPETRLVHWRWIFLTLFLGGACFGVAWDWRHRLSEKLRGDLEASRRPQRANPDAPKPERDEQEKEPRTAAPSQIEERWRDPRLRSGELARERRSREWALRLAHDPSLAVTPLELRLVQMKSLGKDVKLADDQALVELARLAAPPGSRIEVVPENSGYLLRVAFSMASMTPLEAGAATKHRTLAELKQEVREVCARLVRDVLDAGDTRGLQRLTVSCNRAIRQTLIPAAATPEERAHLLARSKVTMRRIYRVSVNRERIVGVPDWRSVPLSRVFDLLQVEHDEFQDLVLESVAAGELPSVDPAEPLEF